MILNFLLTDKYAKKRKVRRHSEFDGVWASEFWLNVINPWILAGAVILILLSLAQGIHVFPLVVVLANLTLFLLRPYRMWVSQQVYLVLGFVRNLSTSKDVWKK